MKKLILSTATTFICILIIIACLLMDRYSAKQIEASESYQKQRNRYETIKTEEYVKHIPENALHPVGYFGEKFSKGEFKGPSGWEHYYNVPQDTVIDYMREKGYDEETYPYYIADNGCKMLGDYIICAADLDKYSYGTIVETSLGKGIICDTGSLFQKDNYDIDLATDWN